MKRYIALLLVLALAAAVCAGCSEVGGEPQAPPETRAEPETQAPPETTLPPIDPNMKVALITDYADVDDQAYNQITFEAAKAWCEENKVDFTYLKPTGDSTAERAEKIKEAAANGYNVLLLPGYAFAGAIAETVESAPDVRFIALDVSEYDLQDAKGTASDFSWKYPANLYSSVYRAEQAGYLAGWAAVKLGYTKLGFLGGLAVPEVVRYGYGFIQGVNDAAKELGNQSEIELKYIYNNTFCPGDAFEQAVKWYEEGTEVILGSGGYGWQEIAEAAKNTGGRLIGVDVDLAPIIEARFGKGLTVTSAMKNIGGTVRTQLDRIAFGGFEGGRVEKLGIVSDDPAENYVQLPASTQWAEGKFTEEDYKALVADLFNGKITVSADTENAPAVEITVDYQGNIK